MERKQKIAFLFGAGAERCFGLPNGYDYLMDSFFCRTTQKIKAPLKDYFNNTYYTNKSSPYKLSKDTLSFNDISILKRIAKLSIDNNKIESDLLKRVDIDSWKRDSEVYKEFSHLLESYKNGEEIVVKNECLSKILGKDKFSSEEFTNILKPGIAGILDNYFHTIVDPQRYGPNNFSKIFYYYWSCFFSITDKILEKRPELFQEFLNDDSSINYGNIISNIQKFLSDINVYIEKEIQNCKNYYTEIEKQILNSDFYLNGVITTNYLNYVSKVFSSITQNIAYPNGNFSLFEFPEHLEVRDDRIYVQHFDNSEIFFPFIFGQSYIKPIVCSKQTKEFNIISEILELDKNYEETTTLVVLGYEMNPDDNHLNAFIHEFVENGNRLIFVTDQEEKYKKSISNLYLRDKTNCDILLVSFSEDVDIIVDKIFKKLKNE